MTKRLNLAAVLLGLVSARAAIALPTFTAQPADQSLSLGAIVTLQSSATTTAPPLSYQWRFNAMDLSGATKRMLVLTNVQMANAGGYSVVATDSSGSVTSRVARLEIDPTFTIITAGPVVADGTPSGGVAWGDYNNDGLPDLLVGHIFGSVDLLFQNKGGGLFQRMLTNVIGGLGLGGGEWADVDNDGFLDLYTVSARDLGVSFFHNQGNGTLLRLTNAAVAGPLVSEHTFSGSAAWGDYDGDGFVDLFVANGAFGGDLKNFLYHNQGDGTFAKVTTGDLVNDLFESWTGAWADYDDDGRLDLFVTSNGGFTPSGLGEDNQLYHNDGPAGFSRRTATQIGLPLHDGGFSRGCAWGDYDNDGHLDLFVAGRTNLLYHGNGDGTFQKITTGAIVTDATPIESIGCTWVDYDNDGHIDLFVVNVEDNNFLYHNNGDGTFIRITSGSLVNDGATLDSVESAWADYDNDGFMDVVIASTGNGNNQLFHNNGNHNHWINLNLVGTASNRSAIGAKVRIVAAIGGKSVWQRRDIGSNNSQIGQSDLRASIGLGNATNIDTVRIEWPSGTIQELQNLPSDQFITITEPARLKGSMRDSHYNLLLNGGLGFEYDIQSSSNLVDWTSLATVTTTNMVMPVISVDTVQMQPPFFVRALRR